MSQNYLSVGQNTGMRVENGTTSGYSPPIVITSTGSTGIGSYSPTSFGVTSGTSSSMQGTLPVSNSTGGVIYPPSIASAMSANGYSSVTSNTTQTHSLSGGGKSAKDLIMGNTLEAKAEMANMRKSQQMYLTTLGNATAMREEIGGGKFDTRITNPSRDMAQSSYVSRDTVGSVGGMNAMMSNQISNQMANMMNDMKFTNFQYIAELERNLGEMRMENNNLKRSQASSDRQLSQMTKEMEYMQEENQRLRSELHKLEQVRVQLEEVTLELDRMKADRDFHNEQHLNLRKELLEIVKQEYELDSLKREKVFIEGELRNYKEKSVIYEKQIDELTILAKRPVSKGTGDGTDKQEHYYAKKILELETKLKDTKKAHDDLKRENDNFKVGMKGGLDESKLTAMDFRASTPDNLMEQLNLLKKKNESLKKENEIIRRELKNLNPNADANLSRAVGGGNDSDARIRELQKQIEQLTRKNLKLEEDLLTGGAMGGSGSSMEVLELRNRLEDARKEIARLRNGQSNFSGSGDQEHMRQMMSDYLEEIGALRKENEDLKRNGGGGGGFGGFGTGDSKLRAEIESLRAERDQLKYKVAELQSQLEVKNHQIETLKSQTAGPDQDGLLKLVETNHRLVSEINKLQERMRQMEGSMNNSISQFGGNNSVLNPASQFMMS